MATEESLSPVVDQIYEAMLEPGQWPQALTAVAETIKGQLPMLHYHDTRMQAGRFLLHAGYDPDTVLAYTDYYSARNVWLRNGAALLNSRTVRSSHMMCSRRELVRSEFYSDFLKPLGLSQAVGGTLITHDEGAFSCISVFGGPARADFAEDDLRVLEVLVPHLRRALQVHTRLLASTAREGTWLETLEKLSTGVLLVNSSWTVVYANPAAQALLGTEGALVFDRSGIRASHGDDTARLQNLIGRAAQTSAHRALHSGGVLRIRQANGEPPLEITISPLSAGAALPGGRAVAALYLRTPDSSPEGVRALASEYGLTAGEKRIFEALASGVSGKQAAEELGISYNTLKTHLQHIFSKTGTRKQIDLVHLAHSNAPPRSPSAPARHPKG